MKFNKIAFSVLTFISSLIILASCNDLPTEIGYSLVDDTVSVHLLTSEDTTIITGFENYTHNLALFNSGYLYLGKSKEMVSNIFYRFSIDTLLYKKVKSIISAELVMTPYKYNFGDTSSNNLSFKIYEINNLWTNKFSNDSLKNNPGFLGNKVLGSYDKNIPTIDSLLSSFNVELDKDFILNWINKASNYQTAAKNYGFALIPDLSSNVIRQFKSQAIGDSPDPIAYIKVKFINDSNAVDSTVLESSIEFSCISNPNVNKELIQIQSATGQRSKLFFDISMIPDLAAIHYSQLELTVDKSSIEYGNIAGDTTISMYYYSEKDTSLVSPILTFNGSFNKATNKCTFNSVTIGLETFMRYSKKGFFVLVKGNADVIERERLDKMAFYGPNYSDKSKRPFLKLIYSKRLRSSDVK